MGTGHDDGIYVSERQRRRRRRKIGTAAAGVALALGAVAYVTTTWYLGRDSTVTGIAPIAPAVPPSETPPSPALASPALPSPGPTVGPPPGTMSAARRSWLPSPVPSPSAPDDDELATTLVSRLLAPRSPAPGVLGAADAATVRNERLADGTQLRVVSARDDLTGQWRTLGAADAGNPIGASRCTQNFVVDGAPLPQNRPGLLLCWRTTPAASIIVVASGVAGRPTPALGSRVIDREWLTLGF
jgi:hypothetical protein